MRATSKSGLQPELAESSDCLFLDEKEIARRLGLRARDWPAKAKSLEHQGLPPIHPLIGRRYWPAVRAFWDKQYGLTRIDVSQPDGEENLDAL